LRPTKPRSNKQRLPFATAVARSKPFRLIWPRPKAIAGFTPGSFQAVYNGTKAFLNSFSFALREELKDTKVTVTCLMPGAAETEFFRRAEMLDTAVGTAKKDDPAKVANDGFDAMIKGEGDIVSGFKNKVQTTAANVTPAGVLASQHRKTAEPGTAKEQS
jgi:short-subunit dehydrogenase